MQTRSFKLSDSFLDNYKKTEPDWGPLGEVTFFRTYSRKVNEGTAEERNEEWWETVRRVVEGTFNIQKEYVQSLKLPWNNEKARKSAQIMYDKIFNFKFLPPGRGLWMMGTDFVKEKGSAGLNNCGFVSTDDIATRGSFAFTWTMDALMMGVGIGFDTKGAGLIEIKEVKENKHGVTQIADSREGWVHSLGLLIDAFFYGKEIPEFDYSLIRPEGEPIRGFGGVASGPGPLKLLHERVKKLLSERAGEKIKSTDIVDLMNMIGACVVAGNVRRSAEIAFGNPEDEDFVTMKDYNKFPKEVKSHRWASNNSIFAEVGKTDYSKIAESIALNGEPGVIWLENMQKYGRLKDGETWADRNVKGSNPCLTGDTLISVVGESGVYEERLDFLVDKYKKKEEMPKVLSYNVNDKRVEVDEICWGDLTRKEADVISLELEDGSIIKLTPDHKVFTENRNWIEAKDLTEEDVLVSID